MNWIRKIVRCPNPDFWRKIRWSWISDQIIRKNSSVKARTGQTISEKQLRRQAVDDKFIMWQTGINMKLGLHITFPSFSSFATDIFRDLQNNLAHLSTSLLHTHQWLSCRFHLYFSRVWRDNRESPLKPLPAVPGQLCLHLPVDASASSIKTSGSWQESCCAISSFWITVRAKLCCEMML